MPATSLADFISTNMDLILKEWEAFAADILAKSQSDPEAARDHARGILINIAADIEREQTPQEQAEKSKGRGPSSETPSQAGLHGASRLSSGFNVMEEVSEFRALRASVLRLWNEANPTTTQGALSELVRFNEAIDQALAESVASYSLEKDRYARIFDKLLSSSPDLNYILDLEGRFIYANKALLKLSGVSLNEISGKKFADLWGMAATEFQQHLHQAIESRVTYRGDLPHRHPDGKEVSYEYLLVPVLDMQGQVEAIAGSARDMTERKRLESDFAREKLLSDTIIESAPGAFFMIDQQNRLVKWNHYLCLETGLSDDQLRSATILDAIHPDDRELAAAKFLTAFATGYARMEVRVNTPQHGIRYFLKSARRFHMEGVPYVAGFCFDVTNRKQSERALVKEKVFSDALIESMPGAFYVINREGSFFRWNNYLNRLTGLSNNALRQQPVLLIIHKEDQPLAAQTMKNAFENGYAQSVLRVLTHDRGVRLFFMTARRFQVGMETYLVGVGTDTTEWLARMKHLEHEAWTDPLTKTANRGHFMQMAEQEFARCRRYGHPISVWMLDIDHFKTVNDTYGHQSGDLVLKSLVSTSQQTLRDWDILGRMGGEEFAVLLPETESQKAIQVAERLRQTVATTRTPLESGQSVGITISIGIATAQDEDVDLATLLARADKALYEAKRSGRDKVCLAEQHILLH
ncbi:MAG: diguanylate cyclase [Pseudomonadota bacterium]